MGRGGVGLLEGFRFMGGLDSLLSPALLPSPNR